MNNIELLSKAINQIIDIKGTECFKNAVVFCAILDDLVPQLVTERKIFHRVLNDNMLEELGELQNIDLGKSNYSWAKIERKLMDDYGLREEWCQIIVQSFSEAYKQSKHGIEKSVAEKQCTKQSSSRMVHYQDKCEQINIWEEYKVKPQDIQEDVCVKVAVIGIGGAGNNFINRMIEQQISDIDFIGVNTDKRALQLCKAQKVLLIGEKITLGLGAGSKYEIGEKVAEEDVDQIKALLRGIDILFITCGIGGGTGAGGAPVVARIAKQMGILTIAIVMKPFKFEAVKRHRTANHSMKQLKKSADTVIAISNDVSLEFVNTRTTLQDALKILDAVCWQAIQVIINSINYNSLENISFVDLRRIMVNGELAHVGIGTAEGKEKIVEALKIALNSPWLEKATNNTSKVFIHLSGDITISDIENAKYYIQEQIGDINVIASACYEEDKCNEVSIVIIVFEVDNQFNIRSSIKLSDFKIPDFLKK